MDRRISPALFACLACLCLMFTSSAARAEMIDSCPAPDTSTGTVQSGTPDAIKTIGDLKNALQSALDKLTGGGSAGGGSGGTSTDPTADLLSTLTDDTPLSALPGLLGLSGDLEDTSSFCLALLSLLNCTIPNHIDPADNPGTDPTGSTSNPAPTGNGNTAGAETVPEPSSLVLVGLGSVGLACWRRRQKGTSSTSRAA